MFIFIIIIVFLYIFCSSMYDLYVLNFVILYILIGFFLWKVNIDFKRLIKSVIGLNVVEFIF